MLEEFYVGRGDRRFGPFSAARLRGLAAAGEFRAGDTVWKEGMGKPVLAVKVKNLFAAAAAQPAATVPPAAEEAPTQPSAGREAVEDIPTLPGPPPEGPADDAVLPPEHVVEARRPVPPPPEPVRKRRAMALKGAVILSQDGVRVQYRKKCSQCGHEDTCRSSMLIGNGVTRTHFFCTRCRKNRSVELQGVMQ